MQSYLLIIESNTTGTGLLALQQAQTLGLSPIFLTQNPQRYPGLEKIDCPTLICNTNSLEALMETITLHFSREQIRGMFTTSEFYLETVAYLADIYQLPGNSPQAIRVCRHKGKTRQYLKKAGVRQPRFMLVESADDIARVCAQFTLPCVVKPVDDTGSNNVRLCQTWEEVEKHMSMIVHCLTNARGQTTTRAALVEEYLAAPEFSVEMFSWEDETICLGITEKSLTGFPYFVEHRHIFPARLPEATVEEMQTTVRTALRTVGITRGATHTEVKLTPAGCAIIEINARPAGGMIPELIYSATGIDLLKQQLHAAVHQRPDLQTIHSGHAGIQFLITHEDGTFESIQGIEHARRMAGVRQITVTARPGAVISPPRSAYDRLGYVIVEANTHENVVQRLDKAVNELTVCLAHVAA